MKKSTRIWALLVSLMMVCTITMVWAEEVPAAVETAETAVEETEAPAEEVAEEVVEEPAPFVCPGCNEETELNEDGKNPHELPCSIYAPVDEEGNKIGEDSIHYSCDGTQHTEEVNIFCAEGHTLCQSQYVHTCVIVLEEDGEDLGCGATYLCEESNEHAICLVCGDPWCDGHNARHKSICNNPFHRPCGESYDAADHALCECGEGYVCESAHDHVEEEEVPQSQPGDNNRPVRPGRPEDTFRPMPSESYVPEYY